MSFSFKSLAELNLVTEFQTTQRFCSQMNKPVVVVNGNYKLLATVIGF